MSGAPKVVITGLGAICASGLDPDGIFDAILSGSSSIAPSTSRVQRGERARSGAMEHKAADGQIVLVLAGNAIRRGRFAGCLPLAAGAEADGG